MKITPRAFETTKAFMTDLATAPVDLIADIFRNARVNNRGFADAALEACSLPVIFTLMSAPFFSVGNAKTAALGAALDLVATSICSAVVGSKRENGEDGPTMRRTRALKAGRRTVAGVVP